MTNSSVMEMRIYDLVPGNPGRFSDYFDEHFVGSQEQAGVKIWGQFSNLENPNQFVWFRGFEDMEQRQKALEEFYGGPVWKEYKEEANALMTTWDNVRLLKPAFLDARFPSNLKRQPYSSGIYTVSDWQEKSGIVTVLVFQAQEGKIEQFLEGFKKNIIPALEKGGGQNFGLFVTEPSENTFAVLQVTQKEGTVVWVGAFSGQDAFKKAHDTVSQTKEWNELNSFLHESLTYQLKPSSRSRLFYRSK